MSMNAQEVNAAARFWPVGLVVGILYLILGFVVLSYEATSLTLVSILIGVSFVFTGITWVVLMPRVAPTLKWFWLIAGTLAIIAGIVAFAYPDESLRVLSLIVGWTLLLTGLLDAIVALTHRAYEYWWLSLIAGLAMFALGAWAVRETERSVVLLLTIVGVYCLIRGIIEIVGAFRLRGLKEELVAD